MTNRRPNGWLFAALWCGLAAWQTWRAFSRCETADGWAPYLWAKATLSLAAPLARPDWRSRRTGAARQTGDAAVITALLVYVPVTIAMRLVEVCAASR
jgi:hypothetical protein